MKLQIRQEREKRKWTQEFVAAQLGISAEAVSMLETGQRKPSYDVLVKLMELYGYSDPRLLFAVADDTNLSGT